jgi:hypothetical protein
MSRRGQGEDLRGKLLRYAETFKADALKSCASLKGADLEKAKADIDKVFWEIANGKRKVHIKDGKVVATPGAA